MKTIYKYPLQVTDTQEIEMPAGGMALSVQMQNGVPCLWAVVDTDAPKIKRIIHVYGTGHPMESHVHRYISTFQMQGGALVFHAFEEQ